MPPNGTISPPPTQQATSSARPKRVYAANQTQAYYQDTPAGPAAGSGFLPAHGHSQSASGGALFSPGETQNQGPQYPSSSQTGPYHQGGFAQRDEGGHGPPQPGGYSSSADGVSGMAQQFQGMGIGSRPVSSACSQVCGPSCLFYWVHSCRFNSSTSSALPCIPTNSTTPRPRSSCLLGSVQSFDAPEMALTGRRRLV